MSLRNMPNNESNPTYSIQSKSHIFSLQTKYKDLLIKQDFEQIHRLLEQTTMDLDEYAYRIIKGIYLSVIGHYENASFYLNQAVLNDYESYTNLSSSKKYLLIDGKIHHARIARYLESIEHSNHILDEIIYQPFIDANLRLEATIEMLYNLCLQKSFKEAFILCRLQIRYFSTHDLVAQADKIKSYKGVVAYFQGNYVDYLNALHTYQSKYPNEIQVGWHRIDVFKLIALQFQGNQNQCQLFEKKLIQRMNTINRNERMELTYVLAIYHTFAYLRSSKKNCSDYELALSYSKKYIELLEPYHSIESFDYMLGEVNFIFKLLMHQYNIHSIMRLLESSHATQQKRILWWSLHFFAHEHEMNHVRVIADYYLKDKVLGDQDLLGTYCCGYLALIGILEDNDEMTHIMSIPFLQSVYSKNLDPRLITTHKYQPVLEFALVHELLPEITSSIINRMNYQRPKIYIQTLGNFNICSYSAHHIHYSMRSKKERELFALLLDSKTEGITKDQIYHAIWSESESNDIKKLIGVNLAHIKKDLANMNLESILNKNGRHYYLNQNSIILDTDLLDSVYRHFVSHKDSASAMKIIDLYKGDYLEDFEAHWAMGKRLHYQMIYQKAVDFILDSKQQNLIIY